MLMHGNKTQVGFVLFRSELANHVLHAIPLDVCGADTQGATGYMISQSIKNAMKGKGIPRDVLCLLTQTLVDVGVPPERISQRAIGPWFDREKADNYRQMRGWSIVEEPGRGYRRAVPSYPVKEILEMKQISDLVSRGTIVIAGGGGGIPVIQNSEGDYQGIEAVVESEQIVPIVSTNIQAKVLILVIENEQKYIRAGLNPQKPMHISLAALTKLREDENIQSSTVKRSIRVAFDFINQGGEQVIITSLKTLPNIYDGKSGVRIGSLKTSIELFNIGE
jgi:carbamate kinase